MPGRRPGTAYAGTARAGVVCPGVARTAADQLDEAERTSSRTTSQMMTASDGWPQKTKISTATPPRRRAAAACARRPRCRPGRSAARRARRGRAPRRCRTPAACLVRTAAADGPTRKAPAATTSPTTRARAAVLDEPDQRVVAAAAASAGAPTAARCSGRCRGLSAAPRRAPAWTRTGRVPRRSAPGGGRGRRRPGREQRQRQERQHPAERREQPVARLGLRQVRRLEQRDVGLTTGSLSANVSPRWLSAASPGR